MSPQHRARHARKVFPVFLTQLLSRQRPLVPAITEFCDRHGIHPDLLAPFISPSVRTRLELEVASACRVSAVGHVRADLDDLEGRQYRREPRAHGDTVRAWIHGV